MEQKAQSRTERKKEETQKRIIATAIELFNKNGIDAVTMEQIAETVDIAKGTLYNYFGSKEELINAFIQHTFQDRNPDRIDQLRLQPDTRTRLQKVFAILVEGVKNQKEIFETFMVYRMKRVISFKPVDVEESGLSALIQAIIEMGQQSGELRTDLPEEYLAGLFEYSLIAAIRPLYIDPETYDQEKSVNQSVELFLHGAMV